MTVWQARVTPTEPPEGESSVVRVLMATEDAGDARYALADELARRSAVALEAGLQHMYRGYHAASGVIELGADAVELDGERYELIRST